MTKKETDIGEKLKSDYARWETRFQNGGHDPFDSDGSNLNLIRQQIIADKLKLEEHSQEDLPQEYFQPLPPELPNSYMVCSRDIWYHALRSFKTYSENEDLRYLRQIRNSLSKKVRKESCIDNVTQYMDSLKAGLQSKDFLVLRCHENPQTYLESFSDCRKRVGEMLLKERDEKPDALDSKQLDLFHVGIIR